MMKRVILLIITGLALSFTLARAAFAQSAERPIVVIAHPSVPKLDLAAVKRIFTGKTIEIDGVRVVPVNLAAGALRQRFLGDYLDTTEDEYVGYWTVRRYIGKGTPPVEVHQVSELIDYIHRTPGAIGYVDEAQAPRGVNIVLRR